MANQYGLFWNSVSGDRTYDADSFAEWANTFFSTGVFNGDLQVTPTAGMVVSVGTGYANINGKIRLFEAETTFTLSPASGTYPRIDTIVVRRDETARQISLAYVQGAYSGLDPVPTEPTRTGGVYEIVLAQIMVAAGATAITAGDITDTRADETVCGWITGSVDSVDVDQLTAQARAQFDAWFEEMKGQLSEDAAGHLQLEIDDIVADVSDISDEIGNTDISEIGDGTITGAVSSLNAGLTVKQGDCRLNSASLNHGGGKVYKYGRVCIVNLEINPKVTGIGLTLASVPNDPEFMPLDDTIYMMQTNYDGSRVDIYIKQNGDFMFNIPNASVNQDYKIVGVYISAI